MPQLTQLALAKRPLDSDYKYGRLYFNKGIDRAAREKETVQQTCFSFYNDPWDNFRLRAKEKQLGKLGGWFATGAHYLEEQGRTELLKTIQSKMRICTKEARDLKDRLFEEIDQLTEAREIEPLSDEEKEQLILAVVKTADYLAKKTLELRP